MFNQAYQDIIDDDQASARENERIALENTIELMRHSMDNPANAVLRMKAVHLTLQVWKYFVNDLTSPDNAISNQLKASIISISLFVIRHLEEMRTDRSLSFIPVIEITDSIREGLK